MSDLISRQAGINIVDSETVSTNPEHFKSSEKFIKFMDDADIASFGKWQWANGFNTALVATKVQLKKLPSTQPERDIPIKPNETIDTAWGIRKKQAVCPKCDYYLNRIYFLGDSKNKKVTYCETCGQAIDWEGWDWEDE